MRSRADAAPSWLWTAALGDPGQTLTLDDDAAHHLVRVCRARLGDVVSLTDGAGGHARAEVIALRPQVAARVLALDREPLPAARVLACGAPEGERADWMVEKLAELGVTAFQPLDLARAGWRIGEPRLERWRRLARAALGQSRGRHLMRVLPPLRLEAWLESGAGVGAGAGEAAPGRWVGDPGGAAPPVAGFGPGAPWCGLIGPSPGFEERERRSIEAGGFRAIRLADSRLRTETAAVAMAALRAALGAGAGD